MNQTQLILAAAGLYAALAIILFLFRPQGALFRLEVGERSRRVPVIIAFSALFCAVLFTVPMGQNPHWTTEAGTDLKQYETMTESILSGRLSLDYHDTDPNLAALDNPYDPEARDEAGVSYHWDHAWYQGSYYMYFGVVPVFLLFLPFRVLTGAALPAWVATQIFAALAVFGCFDLLYRLARRFFPAMRPASFCLLAAAFGGINIWYAMNAPSLYCTAIVSGVCLMIWCLDFFVRAVFEDTDPNGHPWRHAFFGALFGALAFGCRPPLALGNLAVLPLLPVFLSQHPLVLRAASSQNDSEKTTGAADFAVESVQAVPDANPASTFDVSADAQASELTKPDRLLRLDLPNAGRLLLTVSPYLIVAVLLMCYNFLRFDDPFEFGQTWQLTIADQSAYAHPLAGFSLAKTAKEVAVTFFGLPKAPVWKAGVTLNGVFFNFPILIGCFAGLFPPAFRYLKKKCLAGFLAFLILVPVLIMGLETLVCPFLFERYHLDIYYLLTVAAFLGFGSLLSALPEKSGRLLAVVLTGLGLLSVICCFLLLLAPIDSNFAEQDPQLAAKVLSFLTFGLTGR